MEKTYISFFKILPFCITTVLFFIFGYQVLYLEETFIQLFIDSYTYGAVFVLGFFSSFVLALPVPAGIWIHHYIQAGLDIPSTIAILIISQSLADITSLLFASFLFGEIYKHKKHLKEKMIALQKKAKTIPLIVFFAWVVFVPLPNEIAGYTLISIGYSLRIIIPVLIVGNSIFNILIISGTLYLF